MSEFGNVTEVNPEPGSPSGARVEEDRVWAAVAHAGALILGFIAPLFVMVTRGGSSPWVREQAVEALNFQITVLLLMLASAVLAIAVIGALAGPVITVGAFALAALAAVKAWQGESYKYPFVWRVVK